jgi:hypothetical protein
VRFREPHQDGSSSERSLLLIAGLVAHPQHTCRHAVEVTGEREVGAGDAAATTPPARSMGSRAASATSGVEPHVAAEPDVRDAVGAIRPQEV